MLRSPSTIRRELRRNQADTGSYEPYAAHCAAAERRPRPKEIKLVEGSRLREYVQEKVQIRWSPGQICHAGIEEYPDDQKMPMSPETIGSPLPAVAGRAEERDSGGIAHWQHRRKPQNTGHASRPRFADPIIMIMIADRPPEIEGRAVPGRWEGDLIIGAANQSAKSP